jgi:putative oxygen-independent coproporphyrinogen III oxidase
MADQSAGVYIHIPWCRSICTYCDFDRQAHAFELIPAYVEALVADIGRQPETAVHSIFFGGGTPSLWEPRAIGRVLAFFRERFDVRDDVEITAECNPTSLDRDRARALVDAGVHRLSIGTQSLRRDQLAFLGRLHDAAGARTAIEGALAAGVPRISTDLIFGLPDQTPEDAREQALALADLGLRHLSCYQLTIEPGTQFGERKKRGLLPKIDDAMVADSFLAIDEALESRGLRHYEISNYASPGEEARHNLAYWRGDEYVGLGCGAYGMVRTEQGGRRWRNPIDPRRYLEWTRGEMSDADIEELPADALLRERIMLGLRIAEGLDLGAAGKDLRIDAFTAARTREIDRLVDMKRLTREGEVLRVPRSAWLFTDDTAARLF